MEPVHKLLRDAISAAVPSIGDGSLIQRLVLQCLVAKSVRPLENGAFSVAPLQMPQLGQEVKAACSQVGPAAWESYGRYGNKLRPVLDDLAAFVSRQQVDRSTLALLNAGALLAQLGPQSAAQFRAVEALEESTSPASLPPPSATAAKEQQAEAEDALVPQGADSQFTSTPLIEQPPQEDGKTSDEPGILVFEFLPEALPFRVTGSVLGSARYAIIRAINYKFGQINRSGKAGLEAGLARAALAAVLDGSKLERAPAVAAGVAATQHAEQHGHRQHALCQLGSCAVTQAQDAMVESLRRTQGGSALLAHFRSAYGASLARLLTEHVDCAHLVVLSSCGTGQSPGEEQQSIGTQQGGLSALLRADAFLGNACRPVSGPEAAPEQGAAAGQPATAPVPPLQQRQPSPATAKVETPPASEPGTARAAGRPESAGHSSGSEAAEECSWPAEAAASAEQGNSPTARAAQQLEPAGSGIHLPPGEDSAPAGSAHLAPQPQPAVAAQATAGAMEAGQSCVSLLRRLEAVQSVAAAGQAGIDAWLVGSFMAAHCSRTAEERGLQVVVLEAMLGRASWEEARAFMEAAVRLTGMAVWQGE
ncbi:hypothetical protein N2152v2_002857 [Parachlorella kessleri]